MSISDEIEKAIKIINCNSDSQIINTQITFSDLYELLTTNYNDIVLVGDSYCILDAIIFKYSSNKIKICSLD